MRRRRIGAFALALVVAGAVAAAPAMGASAASLQRQINQLKNRVSALEHAIDDFYACQTVIPITYYGDPSGEERYGYWYSDDGGYTEFLTTALDLVPDTSQLSPDDFWWVAVVDDSCVSSARAAWRPAPTPVSAGKAASLRRTVFG